MLTVLKDDGLGKIQKTDLDLVDFYSAKDIEDYDDLGRPELKEYSNRIDAEEMHMRTAIVESIKKTLEVREAVVDYNVSLLENRK